MGRAKLHVVPKAEVVTEVDGPASAPVKKKPPARAKPAVARVGEFMQRDVASCRAYEPLNNVGRLMWERDVGMVVVVDDQLRPVSVVTDRDLAMAAYTQGAPLTNIGIRTCMSQRLVTCAEDATAEDVMALMQEHRVRRVPVVDAGGKLTGILGLSDLTKASQDKKLKAGVKVATLATTQAKILE